MSRSRLIDAKQYSMSQDKKILPEGKRKNHIGSILPPLAHNTSHIEDSDIDKKYRVLPKIGDNTVTLLKEHGERIKKYEDLSKIADLYDDYDNGMNAHRAGIEVKESEKKLGISSETRHKYDNKYPKGGKSIKNKKNNNKKSEKIGKNKNNNKNKSKKTLRARKHHSTHRHK